MARSRIGRRLALALVLAALLPTGVSIWIADSAVRASVERFVRPDIVERLDRSLGLYQELARAVKASMRAEARALARDPALRRAVQAGDAAAAERALRAEFGRIPSLVWVEARRADGTVLARVERGRPLDEAKENSLEVVQPLAEVAGGERPGRPAAELDDEPDAAAAEGPQGDEPPQLVALFAADRARFEELDDMSGFVDTYRQMVEGRSQHEDVYVQSFAALVGLTIALGLGVGLVLARGVTVRLRRLARATQQVAGGDLSVRIPETDSDEITELGRSFNTMVTEVAESRARIEYLQRIGAWQEMARRLAHEIKNPLTPIQLAVQEIHRRYEGDDPAFRRLLDTTREVVEDEVGTLRRLVVEFSDFARLPRADLQRGDLAGFLRDLVRQLQVGDDDQASLLAGVELTLKLPTGEVPAALDRQLLRRALLNLVRNAAQARASSGARGTVEIGLTASAEGLTLDVDDDGPGIPEDIRATVFDPYVTGRTDGTGLGLAIVKKIVVEHGGTVQAQKSPRGGARIRIRLPTAEQAAALAAAAAQTAPETPPQEG